MFGAIGYNQQDIVKDGLVLWLDANDKTSYPGTGTVWRDLSRTYTTGSLTNGPTFSSADGGTIVFDGSDDYVDTTTSILTSNNSYTMGAWAKSASSGFQNRLMGNADSTAGLSGTDIIWGASAANTIYVVRRNGSNNGARDMVSSAISNLSTVWHYVVVTYDHTGVGSILYVDGIQVASNTTLGFTCSLPFRIGRDGNGTDRFSGNISNVHLYNRSLSLTEITQNFNALRPRFGL